VSDDNTYAESLFRTAKYRPELPAKGFVALEAARTWAAGFVHRGIGYVSPAQRHTGQDHAILAARHVVYTEVKERNPARWARHPRNWNPISPVTLNPQRDSVMAEHVAKKLIQSLAA
jgi:putative transposase